MRRLQRRERGGEGGEGEGYVRREHVRDQREEGQAEVWEKTAASRK